MANNQHDVMAIHRIKMELDEFEKDPPEGCSAGPIGDDLYSWEGMISGPSDSPYQVKRVTFAWIF
uniref:UBC core domain-containing protein n=1 Tax=Tetranychus urticae TaxID=32264 RepID=T1KBT0_TETUR